MATPFCSIHPYFKIRHGKTDEAMALLPKFIERTKSEKGVLHYEFTIHGDEVFCREAYVDAEAVLFHLENVGPILMEMLEISDLQKLEFHGPEAEIEKLREPLAHLKPAFFVYRAGLCG